MKLNSGTWLITTFSPLGKQRLERHRLAAQVHVRLEAFEPRRLAQGEIGLGELHRVRWNVQRSGAGAAHANQVLPVLRLLSLGIEVDAELDGVGDVLAGARVVDVPRDARTRQHQHAAVGPHQFHALADGPFAEPSGRHLGRRRVGIHLENVGVGMVRDLASLDAARAGLPRRAPSAARSARTRRSASTRCRWRAPSVSTARSGRSRSGSFCPMDSA